MLTLDFKIEKLHKTDKNGFFHTFKQAEVVEKNLDNLSLKSLIKIISSDLNCYQKSNFFDGDIYLNNISFKNDVLVQQYIQKHSLFLFDFFVQEELTVAENINLFSSLWRQKELEKITLSAFFLDEIQNQKTKHINQQQKAMLNLTKLTACPAYMWFIDKKLLQHLSEENLYIINNIINIRIKQGGICLILNSIKP